MTVSLSLLAGTGWQFFDNSGDVLTGGLLYSYLAGTTTPATTYINVGGAVANSNPIVLDAAGRVPYQIWLTDGVGYKFRLETSTGTQIGTWDNITSQNTASTGLSASAISYTAAGSSTVRTVQAKLQESVSVKDFGAVGDGVTDDTAAIQAALNTIGVSSNNVVFSQGNTYLVNDKLTVSSKSNFVINGNGATIKAANGMTVAGDKGLLYLLSCTNFSVNNLNFDANRANRTPAEVYAHSLTIINCQNFVLNNVNSKNAVCDGMYFGATDNTNTSTYCQRFTVINCIADNCYRQGASIINAYDYQFIGGLYTNTTGTAPQCGIDIESNVGATLGNARGRFYGTVFSNNAGSGLQISNVGGSKDFVLDGCYFSANAKGGLLAYSDLTHTRNCVFENHTVNPGGAVAGVLTYANAASMNGGSIVGNSFKSNTSSLAAIFVGAGPENIRISNNNIIDNSAGIGINLSGNKNVVIRDNVVKSCGGIGVNVTTSTDAVIEGNTITACVGRGIFDSSTRTRIVNNYVADITSVSGAYIQVAGSNQLVSGNVCSSASPVSDIGIRVDTTALAVNGNICVNLNSTDSYSFITASTDDMFYNNIGGTANDRRRVRAGMAVPSFTTGARPTASAVALGQCIFNTTTNKPNWSDGSTNWYNADGTVA